MVPIPGTRSRARVAENVAAETVVLTATDLETLEAIAGRVAGNRYADMNFTPPGRE